MRNFFLITASLGLLFLHSCGNGGSKEQTPVRGTASIVVDESLQPIIDDQLNVFNSSYSDAHIHMVYKPEVTALNLFLSDSIKVAVLARTLTPQEKKHFENKGMIVRTNRFAIDGIALVNDESSPDTSLLVSDVIACMLGKPGKISQLVFANANSSTFRYLKELAAVTSLPEKGVYALESNEAVIRYVTDHPGAVGAVGMNWIEQPDPAQEKLVARVKYLSIKDPGAGAGKNGYYQPNQTTLALKQYPMMRNLYIIDCSGRTGVGTGFAAFIAGERGQRLVLKSGLLPDKLPSREILIK